MGKVVYEHTPRLGDHRLRYSVEFYDAYIGWFSMDETDHLWIARLQAFFERLVGEYRVRIVDNDA